MIISISSGSVHHRHDITGIDVIVHRDDTDLMAAGHIPAVMVALHDMRGILHLADKRRQE